MANKNYKQVQKAIDDIMFRINHEVNAVIEMYLKNIIFSPSTINRIAIYYSIGVQQGNPFKRYILFGNRIVMEFDLEPKLTYEGSILHE